MHPLPAMCTQRHVLSITYYKIFSNAAAALIVPYKGNNTRPGLSYIQYSSILREEGIFLGSGMMLCSFWPWSVFICCYAIKERLCIRWSARAKLELNGNQAADDELASEDERQREVSNYRERFTSQNSRLWWPHGTIWQLWPHWMLYIVSAET